VVFNRSRATWNYLWREGKGRKSRKLGTLAELPTRVDALRKLEALQREWRLQHERTPLTVMQLIEGYKADRMVKTLRKDSQRSLDVWLRHYVIPKWGEHGITDLDARSVEQWLETLPLAPKSRGHVRSAISRLWDYAMWAKHIPAQQNPMIHRLCRVEGLTTVRVREAVNLTVGKFQEWMTHLESPFNVFALVSLSCGLRGSEALALRWGDVDWFASKLKVERSIVNQTVDETKTKKSRKMVHLAAKVLEALKQWHQVSEFTGSEDWIFASPAQLGRLPWSYNVIYRRYHWAAQKIGLKRLGTHSMRHTCRSWMDANGTKLTVQREVMRHSKLEMTAKYGAVVTGEEVTAVEQLAEMDAWR